MTAQRPHLQKTRVPLGRDWRHDCNKLRILGEDWVHTEIRDARRTDDTFAWRQNAVLGKRQSNVTSARLASHNTIQELALPCLIRSSSRDKIET